MKNQTQELQQMTATILEQQASGVAYQRGLHAVTTVRLGQIFTDIKAAAIAAGYAAHTQEHHLFVEGFLDGLQDNGVTISLDDAGVIVGLSVNQESHPVWQ
jgi:hypothetical protein